MDGGDLSLIAQQSVFIGYGPGQNISRISSPSP